MTICGRKSEDFYSFSPHRSPRRINIMFVYVSRKPQPFNGSATVWLLHINLIKWARRLFRQAIKTALSLYIPSPRILRRGRKSVLNAAITHYVHLGKPFAGRHDAVASCYLLPWPESCPNVGATRRFCFCLENITVVPSPFGSTVALSLEGSSETDWAGDFMFVNIRLDYYNISPCRFSIASDIIYIF